MNENQFDDFFRNKLQNYSSAVPEDMWQRIQQKKDKDRKGFFFRWSLAVLLPIFLIAGYFILQTNKKTYNEKSISSANKQNIKPQNNSNEIPKNAGNNEPINTNPDTTHIKQTNKRILSNKQIDNNEQNHVYPDKGQNKKSKPDQYFSAKKTSSARHISKQKQRSAKYNKKFRLAKDSANIPISNASDSSMNNYQADENIVKKYPDTSNGQAIKIITLPKDSSSKDTLSLSQNQSKKESEPSTQINRNWVLDVYASPDFPINEITAGNANFKMQVSYTVGARVSRSFAKQFSGKTGFQYSQINAKFSDSISLVNRYRSIDIPFFIGYDFKNVHFKTTINAGVIFNLYSWYKGKTIVSYGVADINDANIYRQNTGISLYIGLSFAKPLNNELQLFTEPYFRYRLSYMTKPQAPFNQKINVAGITFGLKYNFQKTRQHK